MAGEALAQIASHGLRVLGRHAEEDEVGALAGLGIRDELLARRARADHDVLAQRAQARRNSLAEVAASADDPDQSTASSRARPTSSRRAGSTITMSRSTAPGISPARSASTGSRTNVSTRSS